MISLDQRKAIVGCLNLIKMRGLDVDHRLEVDDLTLSAFLVFSVRGEISDATALVDELKASMSPCLSDVIINVFATQSKGRGRPKKSGEPPAEGLTIRCVLK